MRWSLIAMHPPPPVLEEHCLRTVKAWQSSCHSVSEFLPQQCVDQLDCDPPCCLAPVALWSLDCLWIVGNNINVDPSSAGQQDMWKLSEFRNLQILTILHAWLQLGLRKDGPWMLKKETLLLCYRLYYVPSKNLLSNICRTPLPRIAPRKWTTIAVEDSKLQSLRGTTAPGTRHQHLHRKAASKLAQNQVVSGFLPGNWGTAQHIYQPRSFTVFLSIGGLSLFF